MYFNITVKLWALGEEYVINNSVKVIPTPGHTLSDVSVITVSKEAENVAITGKQLNVVTFTVSVC